MICPICERETPQDALIPVNVGNKQYLLCGFDALKVDTFIHGSICGAVINIAWGAGRLCWSSWNGLREILRKYNIKEILEFGTGLSSELFLNEGLDLISCDILKEHISIFQKHQGYKHATFIPYPDDNTLPDIEALYPGRQWDFVFVDGPQERSKEVKLAMKLSRRFIYLHDPNMGEQHFFPNETWVPMEGRESKLFFKGIPNHHQQMVQVLKDHFGDREISGVEIGTAQGCLTKSILALPNVAKLITIDPWRHDPKSEFEAHFPQEIQEDRKAFAYNVLAEFGERVRILAMGSDEAAEILKGEKFDFVWIDGDHTGPQVIRDMDNYDPMVKPGGLIGGHDLRRDTPLTQAVEAKYNTRIRRGGDYTWWVVR